MAGRPVKIYFKGRLVFLTFYKYDVDLVSFSDFKINLDMRFYLVYLILIFKNIKFLD